NSLIFTDWQKYSIFNDFKRKHMASESAQGSDYFCINEIRNRNITIRGRCKEKNTFIFADIARVIKVCTNGESLKKRDLFKSKERFRITDCSYTGNPQPVCQYKAINYNHQDFFCVYFDLRLPVLCIGLC
uniref:Ribonuclease A-domain domain-containing protein n=1 Tax=Erpetoichthys calabaricus TaxID=27687 RepID=A0A8C4RUZ4_ERPCA